MPPVSSRFRGIPRSGDGCQGLGSLRFSGYSRPMVAVGGVHVIILLLVWVVGIAVIGAAVYFAVRLAVTHALKAHTRWVDNGKP